MWFKNDLRLHDNKALVTAQQECSEVLCCYCLEKSDFENHDLGFPKADINRFRFLEQSVNNLKANLKLIGGQLTIGIESARTTIPELVQQFQITDIYAEEEYANYELNRIKSLREELPETEFHFFWGKTLYHKDDIPFSTAKIPLTSQAYRIPAGKESEPRKTLDIPKKLNPIKKVKATRFPSYKDYGFTLKEYKPARPIRQWR
ncbi:deoxyribodipyrimidine photo-lyase [Pedobacter paludis]|uniref:deoxyribodipyrimidine photo-lyase n=1 Tax=Pedobacter paludis TaxID=2203212 RepID=UPI00197EB135|nr:deoxyribodipyrimidine photo-lyase [Pedobacter paludis]